MSAQTQDPNTAGRILDQLRAYADEHDGTPPTATAWRLRTPEHPCASTVARQFGSWNRALELAGFAARQPGGQRQRYAGAGVCQECGYELWVPAESGLCGFCEAELEEAAAA